MPRRRGPTIPPPASLTRSSRRGGSAPLTFTYDAASRPVSYLQGTGVTTLTWSPRGVLTQELRADGSIATYVHSSVRNQLVYAQPSPGTNSSYTYDADGMRLRTLEGGVWATMVCDSSAGGGGDYLSVNRSGADDSLFVLMDGEAIGEILGSEARDYLADPLGSVRGGFDSSQDLRDPVSYWPYGERLLSLSPPWGTLFWLGALGYYQDPGSRVYVRARSYSSNTAAWLQVDPLWPHEAGFGYVRGMPVTAVDSSGMKPIRLPGAGLGAAIGAIVGGGRPCHDSSPYVPCSDLLRKGKPSGKAFAKLQECLTRARHDKDAIQACVKEYVTAVGVGSFNDLIPYLSCLSGSEVAGSPGSGNDPCNPETENSCYACCYSKYIACLLKCQKRGVAWGWCVESCKGSDNRRGLYTCQIKCDNS